MRWAKGERSAPLRVGVITIALVALCAADTAAAAPPQTLTEEVPIDIGGPELAGRQVFFVDEGELAVKSVSPGNAPVAIQRFQRPAGKRVSLACCTLDAAPSGVAAGLSAARTGKRDDSLNPIFDQLWLGPLSGPLQLVPGTASRAEGGVFSFGIGGDILAYGSFPATRSSDPNEDRIVIKNIGNTGGQSVVPVPPNTLVGRVRVAGRFVAWSEIQRKNSSVVVYDRISGAEAYRAKESDVGAIESFELQADGKLAVQYEGAVGPTIAWLSPADPTPHRVVAAGGPFRFANDRIAFIDSKDGPLGLGESRVVLSDLNGGRRAVTPPVPVIGSLDYDGERIAWTSGDVLPCILEEDVPSGEPEEPVLGGCRGSVAGPIDDAKLSKGTLRIPIACLALRSSGCVTGSNVRIQARLRKGRRGRRASASAKRTLNVGTAQFATPRDRIARVKLKLSKGKLRFLRRRRVRLSVKTTAVDENRGARALRDELRIRR